MLSCFSHVRLFATLWTVARQAPLSRQETGVGCQALLQGIFLTQGSNPSLLHLLHWRACSLPLAPPGKPTVLARILQRDSAAWALQDGVKGRVFFSEDYCQQDKSTCEGLSSCSRWDPFTLPARPEAWLRPLEALEICGGQGSAVSARPCVSLCVRVCVSLSGVRLSVTSWTVFCQALLSMEFPRQEYWSGLPSPPPGDLPHTGIEPVSLASPELAGGFLTTAPAGKPCVFLGTWKWTWERHSPQKAQGKHLDKERKRSKCIITLFTPCMRFKPNAKETRNVLQVRAGLQRVWYLSQGETGRRVRYQSESPPKQTC